MTLYLRKEMCPTQLLTSAHAIKKIKKMIEGENSGEEPVVYQDCVSVNM